MCVCVELYVCVCIELYVCVCVELYNVLSYVCGFHTGFFYTMCSMLNSFIHMKASYFTQNFFKT